MSSDLRLDIPPGDNRWVQELFLAVWQDWQAHGRGLTEGELLEVARLKFNTSGTIQYWEIKTGSPYKGGVSTTPDPDMVETLRDVRVDRGEVEWSAVSATIANEAIARMKGNQTGRHNGRGALIVNGIRGPQPKDAEVRWTVNVKDGVPVLPRYYRKPVNVKGGWLTYDPEAERQGTASHIDVMNWIREARAELARPGKRRPAERDALLERAVDLLSVHGR